MTKHDQAVEKSRWENLQLRPGPGERKFIFDCNISCSAGIRPASGLGWVSVGGARGIRLLSHHRPGCRPYCLAGQRRMDGLPQLLLQQRAVGPAGPLRPGRGKPTIPPPPPPQAAARPALRIGWIDFQSCGREPAPCSGHQSPPSNARQPPNALSRLAFA